MKKSLHLTAGEVSAFLDGELELDGKRKEHLTSCSACAGLLEEGNKLRRLARATKPEVPTEKMWRAIEAELSEAPAPRPRFWAAFFRRPRWLAAGTAGTVAAALLMAVLFRETAQMPAKRSLGAKAPVDAAASVAAPAPEPVLEEKASRSPASAPAAPSVPVAAPAPASQEAEDPGVDVRGGGYLSTVDREPSREVSSASAPRKRAAKKAPAPESRSAPTRAKAFSADAVSRPSFVGERYVLEADEVDSSRKDVVKALGRVVVRPARAGGAYFAIVDGFSRTVTGELKGPSAEVLKPGELLILRTKD